MQSLLRVDFAGNKKLFPMAFRAVGMGASLVINIVVARELDLEQIAYYFLYATLSYFGNATLFVGLGIVLQRNFSRLATSRQLDKALLIRFLSISFAIGMGIVAIFTAVYLYARGANASPWRVALCCATLSGAVYLSSAGKDLLALGDRLNIAALFSFLEQILRLGFVLVVLGLGHESAIEITAAVAAGSLISGLGGISVLLSLFGRATPSSPHRMRFGGIVDSVGPIGLSGVFNWLQLQSYRPILLYFGIQPELIGITALLTSLGMAGANPILAVTAQRFIPSVYSGDAAAFRACIQALARAALILVCCSIPAAAAFLFLSGRKALVLYLLLVPIGVLVETGNNVIGAFIHRQNAFGRSMWHFASAGTVGILIIGLSWLLPVRASILPYSLGIAMIVSQIGVVAMIAVLSGRAGK
jgi:hypothetical protein